MVRLYQWLHYMSDFAINLLVDFADNSLGLAPASRKEVILYPNFMRAGCLKQLA